MPSGYEDFKDAWGRALRDSGLPVMGEGEESLDLLSMDRSRVVYVEPQGGQDVEPFFVSAKLAWRWDALQAARTRSTEEDMLTQLLGRATATALETEQPWLRIDITLHASLTLGKSMPMPSAAVWASWAREAHGRLKRIEPLLPDEVAAEGEGGMFQVLAWKGEPGVKVSCTPAGELRLEGVELSAWQAIQLPRHWDDSERNTDEPVDGQLAALFRRVRASLRAWMEVADHLL